MMSNVAKEATIGQLNKEALYYMRLEDSLSEKRSVSVLNKLFFNGNNDFKIEPVRESRTATVDKFYGIYANRQ
jgi:hypothetical protein